MNNKSFEEEHLTEENIILTKFFKVYELKNKVLILEDLTAENDRKYLAVMKHYIMNINDLDD